MSVVDEINEMDLILLLDCPQLMIDWHLTFTVPDCSILTSELFNLTLGRIARAASADAILGVADVGAKLIPTRCFRNHNIIIFI